MIGRFKVITLCGSTKFKNEFELIQKELTLQGNIVLSLCLFSNSNDSDFFNNLSGMKQKEIFCMLDEMHREKIRIADEIFVINKNGYIGESTRCEIAYAKSIGKPVKFLEKTDNYSDIT